MTEYPRGWVKKVFAWMVIWVALGMIGLGLAFIPGGAVIALTGLAAALFIGFVCLVLWALDVVRTGIFR